jgi:short-subunit dehydrogenase
MNIKDKVMIVTGASKGIGEAVARLFAGQGARVVLAARSEERLAALEREIPGSFSVRTDMRKPEDIHDLVQKTLKKFGRIDILVNNAGQGMYGPVEHADIAAYRDIMELNVFGVLRAMQEVIPVMRRQGGGMIVNVSSRVSKSYFPNLGPYASTKYALNALSLTARSELASDHIVVSVLHPKMTATDFGRNASGGHPDIVSLYENPSRAMEIDTPETVARKMLDLIRSEEAEADL